MRSKRRCRTDSIRIYYREAQNDGNHLRTSDRCGYKWPPICAVETRQRRNQKYNRPYRIFATCGKGTCGLLTGGMAQVVRWSYDPRRTGYNPGAERFRVFENSRLLKGGTSPLERTQPAACPQPFFRQHLGAFMDHQDRFNSNKCVSRSTPGDWKHPFGSLQNKFAYAGGGSSHLPMKKMGCIQAVGSIERRNFGCMTTAKKNDGQP